MTDGPFRTIKAALTRPSGLVFGAAVWGLAMPLSLTVPAVLLAPVAAKAEDFARHGVLPDTEANQKRKVVGCIQRSWGIDCSNRKGGRSSSSSSRSKSSGGASSAAERAAELERLRQRQIEANNSRLRSVARARSKLTYPNVNENLSRDPSRDEQWQRETGRKIQSLGRLMAAKKARINRILGDRPINWDGRVRPPGEKPDYPSVLPTIDPWDLKGGKQEPASDQVSIDQIDVPSPRPTDATQESCLGAGIGEESAQWYADRYVKTGKWRYAAGGLLSSLWTPDTCQKTALVLDTALMLGPAQAAAKYLYRRGSTALFGRGAEVAGRDLYRRGGTALVGRGAEVAGRGARLPKMGRLYADDVAYFEKLAADKGRTISIHSGFNANALELERRANRLFRPLFPDHRADKLVSRLEDIDVRIEGITGWRDLRKDRVAREILHKVRDRLGGKSLKYGKKHRDTKIWRRSKDGNWRRLDIKGYSQLRYPTEESLKGVGGIYFKPGSSARQILPPWAKKDWVVPKASWNIPHRTMN